MGPEDYQWLVSTWGYIGVFTFTFTISLIPFFSPSNALTALLIAIHFPDMNKLTIALAVSTGATAAKTIHFIASYGLGIAIEKRTGKKRNIGNYGKSTMYLLNIVAAATPIPDEWIIVPMGISEVSLVWFIVTYLTGKLLITVPAAYIGYAIAPSLKGIFGENTLIISIATGIIITAIFILVDVRKIALKILTKLGITNKEENEKLENKKQV